MKKIILLLIVLIFSNSSFAQNSLTAQPDQVYDAYVKEILPAFN